MAAHARQRRAGATEIRWLYDHIAHDCPPLPSGTQPGATWPHDSTCAWKTMTRLPIVI